MLYTHHRVIRTQGCFTYCTHQSKKKTILFHMRKETKAEIRESGSKNLPQINISFMSLSHPDTTVQYMHRVSTLNKSTIR